MDRIIVVGASLAGARTVQNLRRAGYEGDLVLVGAEPHLPYDRPPLSKNMLTEDLPADEVTFDPREAYDELDVELLLGTPASALDTTARTLTVGDETLPFDGLVIATGAHARRIPGTAELAGVHTLRTIDDSLAIREALAEQPDVVVVGAGFIGSEVAAAAVTRGCTTTVLEAGPAPLMRGLGADMGTIVGGLHEHHGATLQVDAAVAGFEGTDRVEAVRLADGTTVPAGLVVVGIGVSPSVGWLEGSGLTIDDGVVCDGTLNCGVDGIYAIGDVVQAPNAWVGPEPLRVEHWTTAIEHAMLVATNMLDPGSARPYDSVPFVWSDQYDDRIQIAGHPSGDDDAEILVGSADERSFVAGYRRDDRLTGVMALNSIKPFVQYRRLLMTGPTWTGARELADELNA